MPYKDIEKRRALIRDHYRRNKDQYKKNQREAKRQKQEYIRKAKEKPCADWGKEYPYYVMDLDHTRGQKFRQVSAMKDCTLEKIKEEISKCDVVCSNCHRIRTHSRRNTALV